MTDEDRIVNEQLTKFKNMIEVLPSSELQHVLAQAVELLLYSTINETYYVIVNEFLDSETSDEFEKRMLQHANSVRTSLKEDNDEELSGFENFDVRR
jgi:hypothetical protein